MRNFLVVLTVLTLAFVFLKPNQVLASSIGVSPSELTVQILKGENSEQKFNISVSEISREYNFAVSVREGSEFLDLKGQQEFTIPINQRSVEFPFLIKTDNLDFGDYESEIIFTLEQTSTDPNVVAVNYALIGEVKFSVVDEAYFLALPIDISLVPEANNNIALSDLQVVGAAKQSKELIMNCTLKNEGDRSLQNAVFDFSVSRDGKQIFSNHSLVSEVTEVGQSVSVERSFKTDYDLFPGVYKITVSSGDSNQSIEIIIPDSFRLTARYVILFAGCLVLLLVVWFKKELNSLRKKPWLATLSRTFKKSRLFKKR